MAIVQIRDLTPGAVILGTDYSRQYTGPTLYQIRDVVVEIDYLVDGLRAQLKMASGLNFVAPLDERVEIEESTRMDKTPPPHDEAGLILGRVAEFISTTKDELAVELDNACLNQFLYGTNGKPDEAIP